MSTPSLLNPSTSLNPSATPQGGHAVWPRGPTKPSYSHSVLTTRGQVVVARDLVTKVTSGLRSVDDWQKCCRVFRAALLKLKSGMQPLGLIFVEDLFFFFFRGTWRLARTLVSGTDGTAEFMGQAMLHGQIPRPGHSGPTSGRKVFAMHNATRGQCVADTLGVPHFLRRLRDMAAREGTLIQVYGDSTGALQVWSPRQTMTDPSHSDLLVVGAGCMAAMCGNERPTPR